MNSRSNRGIALYVRRSPSGEWWRDKQRPKARSLERRSRADKFRESGSNSSPPFCCKLWSSALAFHSTRVTGGNSNLMSVGSRNKMLKQFQQNVFEAFGKPYVEGALVLNITFCSDSILECNLHNVWPSSMSNRALHCRHCNLFQSTQIASLA